MKAIMLYIQTVTKDQSPQARLVALRQLKSFIETLETDCHSEMTREELFELTGSSPREDFERIRALSLRHSRYFQGTW